MLFLFVEGPDDERFVRGILEDWLMDQAPTQFILYATLTRKKVAARIAAIKKSKNRLIFFRDIDSYEDPKCCIASACKTYRGLTANECVVVVKEIESWYLAGLTGEVCRKLGIKEFRSTDSIQKEQFNMLVPRKYLSRVDFMVELVKVFSIPVAKKKNKSFREFSAREGL